MTVKECYEEMGANYEDVVSRLRTDERIQKFLGKVAADGSFALLEQSLAERKIEEAFRAAHTMKGVCMNLSLTKLYESAAELTEALRGRSEYGADIEPLFESVKKDYAHTTDCIRRLMGE